jgi:hypothetical protein
VQVEGPFFDVSWGGPFTAVPPQMASCVLRAAPHSLMGDQTLSSTEGTELSNSGGARVAIVAREPERYSGCVRVFRAEPVGLQLGQSCASSASVENTLIVQHRPVFAPIDAVAKGVAVARTAAATGRAAGWPPKQSPKRSLNEW